jgi:hypothetical protein
MLMPNYRKIYCAVFIGAFLLALQGQGYSLYNGNPALPEMPEEGFFVPKESWFSFKFGYEGDVLFDRSLRVEGKKSHISHHVNSFEYIMNSGSLTLGFSDRVEIYGLLGAMKTKMSQTPVSHEHVHYDTGYHFSGEMGIRAIVAYWGDTKLSVDAKYFMTNPHIDRIDLNGDRISSSGAKIHETEWQVGAGVSHRVSWFIPYAGFKYSNLRMKFCHLSSLESIIPRKKFVVKNNCPVGFFFGFGFSADRGIAINVEARVLDETAVTAALDIRF